MDCPCCKQPYDYYEGLLFVPQNIVLLDADGHQANVACYNCIERAKANAQTTDPVTHAAA